MAYNQEFKEKRSFEEAIKNADDFFTKGLLKMHKNTDVQYTVAEFRKIARTAFSDKRYKEAREYYDKILKLNSKDHEAVFFKSLCQGLSEKVNEKSVNELFEAYRVAISNIFEEEDMYSITLEYALKCADYVISWFEKSQNAYRKNLAEWYIHNKDQFYAHADLAKKSVDFLDCLMPIILQSDLSNAEKVYPYAFMYCRMCNDFCTSTMFYKINDRDKAIKSSKYAGPLGYSAEEKEDYIKKYDDMCFEVRKFSSDFEKLEDAWSYGFPRLDPPSTYEEQQQQNRVERMMQLQKEAEIDKALVEWRISGGPSSVLREKRIRKYMSGHLEDRRVYQNMKKQADDLDWLVIDLMNSVSDKKQLIDSKNEEIRALKAENTQKNEIIAKLNKKIFGKAKAQEGIVQFKKEILQNEADIASRQDAICQLHKDIEEIETQITDCSKRKEIQRREIDMFLNKCII